MKPAAFAYLKPENLAEALQFVADNADDGKLLAGGQSLVPAMNFRLARPETLIDISGLEALDGVNDRPEALSIGALTRHATFHKPVSDGALGRLLVKVVGHIAHYPIRQRGTFGGSLCHADPAAEWCLVATALDATMRLESSGDARDVPAEAFFRGSFTTALEPNEILTRITIPKLPDATGTGFVEFARRKGDFALAMALTTLHLEGNTIRSARVGLGGVADRALRMTEIEAALVGKPATPETFVTAGQMARDQISPRGDIHGSAEYRRDLGGALLERALAEAAEEARGAVST